MISHTELSYPGFYEKVRENVTFSTTEAAQHDCMTTLAPGEFGYNNENMITTDAVPSH